MLTPSLNFDECLNHVKSGNGLEHLKVDAFDLNRQKEAILTQEELIRALVLTDSPFIVRGESRGFGGTYYFKPAEGDFYFANFLIPGPEGKFRANNSSNDQFATMMSGLERISLGSLVGYLHECAEWNYEDQKASPLYYGRLKNPVWAALLEFTRNVSTHGSSSSSSSSSLWVSSNGLLVSGEQDQPFDIHAKYAEVVSQPPDKDPFGREIPRPRRWHCFRGPGEQAWKGFIRGNGLFHLSTIPDVQVNAEYLPESGVTRSFLFSPEPFKP